MTPGPVGAYPEDHGVIGADDSRSLARVADTNSPRGSVDPDSSGITRLFSLGWVEQVIDAGSGILVREKSARRKKGCRLVWAAESARWMGRIRTPGLASQHSQFAAAALLSRRTCRFHTESRQFVVGVARRDRAAYALLWTCFA